MPSTSKAQRRAAAIAENEPEKLYKRNRGLLKMSKSELHDFASGGEKDLPTRITREGVKKRLGKRK
ncbi:MAG: hypothetical protein HYT40_04015 [Candidatus Sungbacteria bacterium]|uniref:Uncharacterized protein n=1 Tax=Candidatus Sungiibacteriota bacterium TaxID=2750080 RepID=A0A931SE93_9BACT|nr:hypothetical protein [Candidatus Sungbacteria bacterium]